LRQYASYAVNMPPLAIAVALTVVSAAVFMTAAIGFLTATASPSARRAIIAQYEPPSGVAVLSAAIVLGEPRRSVSAALVDLAVRRIIRILAPDTAGGPYRLELLRLDGVVGVDRALVMAVFGRIPAIGTRVAVTSGNSLLVRRLGWAQSEAQAWVQRAGLRVTHKNGWRLLLPFAQLLLVPVTIGMSNASLPLTLAATLFGLGTIGFTFGRYSALTPVGADLRDHLAGLSLYIRLAEADRMRVLQAPGTALRTDDIIHLTERLLGWAVLHGFGREWAAVLERLGTDASTRSDVVADLPVLLAFSASFDGVAAIGYGQELPPDDAAVAEGGGMDFSSVGGDWDGGSDGGSHDGGSDGGGGGGDGGGGGGGD